VRICRCCVWIRAAISVMVRIRYGVRISNRVRRRVKLVNYSLITALPIATSAHPLFTRGPLLSVRRSLKSRKKITKNPYFGVQGRSRSSMLVPPESSSAVLVMIRKKSVSISNRFCARLVDSCRNCTF